VSRRVNRAIGMGYLTESPLSRGGPKLVMLGELLPDDAGVLPDPETLR
jgi:hypothetical protein